MLDLTLTSLASLASLSLHSRFTLASLSLHSRFTLASLSLHSRFTLTHVHCRPLSCAVQHPDNDSRFWAIAIPGARAIAVAFDQQSSTEQTHDYVQFFKDASHTALWGLDKYSGGRQNSPANFPGFGGRDILVRGGRWGGGNRPSAEQ